MKNIKLIMLLCIGVLFIASKSYGQANAFINVLPSNSGIVSVGATIDIIVTKGNTGPISTIPQAKLRPIFQVPASVTFLPNAQQVGLPAGWTILSNTGSQLRLCNSADPIPVTTSRTIILKVKGVTAAPAQSFSGNINFGNGTNCGPGTSVAGDFTTDNAATSTIQVVAPVTLNLNVFIEGYWDGTSAMLPVLANQGQPNPTTDCDSITVELHQTIAPYGTLYSTVAVLHTDGTATAVFSPSTTLGNYYIVIKHRSSIQTWSANPVLIATHTTYDFTTDANQAFGSNQIEVEPNIWAIYSGDIDQNGGIDNSDFSVWEADANDFLAGYLASDLDGLGSSDNADFSIWESNSNNFVGAIIP